MELLTERERAIYNAGFNTGCAETLKAMAAQFATFGSACSKQAEQHAGQQEVPAAPQVLAAAAKISARIRGVLGTR